jgi:hypothetical protein
VGHPLDPDDTSAPNCHDVDSSGIDAIASCFTTPMGNQSPQKAQLCIDVLDCAYVHNCAYGENDLNGCWCTAAASVCQSTDGLEANHGVCFDQVFAATEVPVDLPTASRTQQLDQAIIRVSQDAYPSGAAFWLLHCDRTVCRQECVPQP